MKITFNRTINAPVNNVFQVYSDFGNAAERVEGIESIEILTGEPVGVGTRFRETRIMFGRSSTEEMEITKFNSPNMYQVDAESHGSHYTTLFYFEERGGSTHVKWEFIGTPLTFGAKMMSILGFLAKGATRKMMDKDIADLKAFIES